GIAGILAFGAEGEEELPARSKAAGLQDGLYDVAGRARIRRALQHYQLSRAQPSRDRPGGVDHVAQIRFTDIRQRGGDADDDGLWFVEAAKVVGRLETLCLHLLDDLRRDVADIA